MKHGPIALIEEIFPTFAVDLGDNVSGKLQSNLQEVKARYGPVILLVPPEVDFRQAERWDLLIPTLHNELDAICVVRWVITQCRIKAR